MTTYRTPLMCPITNGGPKIRPLLITATFLTLLTSSAEARPKPVPLLKGEIVHSSAGSYRLGKWSPGVGNAINAIYWAWCGKRYVRCSAGDEALQVVNCETGSTYSVYAMNGQYLGLFQMGYFARSRYGHAWDPWGQARAAFRYYAESGRDWSPWACKPW